MLMSFIQRAAASALCVIALAAPVAPTGALAEDGAWFLHEFGELRSYHGDWLAVCGPDARGSCRLVQFLFEPGQRDRFFGSARLSVESDPESGEIDRIELYARGAPDEPLGAVGIVIDGNAWSLRPGSEIRGARTGAGGVISESYEITASSLLAELHAAMRRGETLRIGYRTQEGAQRLRFSLRGYAAGMAAIDALEARRGR
ncbi:MAG: hypothetical protein AAGM38_05800 [Pseudomonadota bacterium]